jgi:hypothetical protein
MPTGLNGATKAVGWQKVKTVGGRGKDCMHLRPSKQLKNLAKVEVGIRRTRATLLTFP